jgi:hypothetical protein
MHRLWLDEGAGALSLIKVLARPEQALRASQAEQNSPLPTLLWQTHTHEATKNSQDRDRALQTSRRNASRRAPLLLVSDAAVLFGLVDRVSALPAIAALPIALWELSLGLYLPVKGFKPSPITADMV